jgi:bifunctional non-homologous end joining protein LigD
LGPSLAGARRNSTPLTFCCFDVVWMDDELRLAILEQLDLPKPIGVVPRFEGDDAADLLQACEVNGVEGVVIKRLGSLYWPGKRTSEWRKRR